MQDDDARPMQTVSVNIPVSSAVLVVLARTTADALWCGSYDTPRETIRHLRAAADKLEDDIAAAERFDTANRTLADEVLREAQRLVITHHGAPHECGEWRHGLLCGLCGRILDGA